MATLIATVNGPFPRTSGASVVIDDSNIAPKIAYAVTKSVEKIIRNVENQKKIARTGIRLIERVMKPRIERL